MEKNVGKNPSYKTESENFHLCTIVPDIFFETNGLIRIPASQIPSQQRVKVKVFSGSEIYFEHEVKNLLIF